MSSLSAKGEQAIQAFYQAMAKASGQIFTPGAAFSVAPQIQDKIVKEALQVLNILSKINYRTVVRNASNVLSFSVARGITGRALTNKNKADNKKRTYLTADRTFRWEVPFTDIDNWAGVVQLVKVLSPLYLRVFVEEMIFIALKGVERHEDPESFYDAGDPGAQLKKVDRGWAKILETDLPGNIITEWEAGTGVIIYGKTRNVPVGAVTVTTEAAGAKTGIPLADHGFVIGGKIHLKDQAGYVDEYTVESESTDHKVVIDKAYSAGDLDAASKLEQYADFANIGELVAVMKRSIPEVKRKNLENWIGDDILAAYEQKILASADPATPSEFKYMQQVLMSHGNLPSFGLPDFPDSEIWTVNPKVLPIYELRGSRRREAKQDMDISAYTDKTYLEMDNVVEDPEPFIIARNLRQLEAYESA